MVLYYIKKTIFLYLGLLQYDNDILKQYAI
jgi:hypothetical protein